MKYYRVVCTRGHLGAGKGQEIAFAVVAQNTLHACNIARKMPAIKHTKVVCCAKEISEQEFVEIKCGGSAYDYTRERRR